MFIKTYKYFNQNTRQALFDHVEGYVNSSKSLSKEINSLNEKYNVQNIYRFDIGENVDGFSGYIKDYLKDISENKKYGLFNHYPDITNRTLREKIARKHRIKRENIVVSNGLESILDLISRVFLDYNDSYIMPVPDFFLFERYSERMGARPIFLSLNEEDNFEWTEKVLHNFTDLVTRFKPKIVWLSNPCNPTGKIINEEILKHIIEITNKNNVFLVIDEAYGECINSSNFSASKYIKEYSNIMVLGTFSKAYGLAGIRLGYVISSSDDIIKALLLHRQYFPVSQSALDMAALAIDDTEFIKSSNLVTEHRKRVLFNQIRQLESFKLIPSYSNVFILKNICLSDIKLNSILKKYGIISSLVNLADNNAFGYNRFTIRRQEENNYLFKVLSDIDKEIMQISGRQSVDFIMN